MIALAASLGPARGPEQGSSAPPIILVSVDTLRADHLSAYGYQRLSTPHIDSLARGGTLFAQISSQAPITLPSHVSLFTSTYPFANGIRENAQVLPPGAVTLAGVLAAHGYRTAAFIGGYFLDRRYGLNQGFQTYDSPFGSHAPKGAMDLKRPAAEVLSAAEKWLDGNSQYPFFLFVHLFDLHQPYAAPAEYHARAPHSEYDQELAYVDDRLGGFFQFLARAGLDRRALIVLFSDHGESLGDHGETTHGYFVYRSTLHVALIFHWPQNSGDTLKLENALPRVEAPAGLIDVAPTVLAFLGIQPPPSFCGHDLLELARNQDAAPRDVYSESSYAHDKFGWATLRSLRRGDDQFIDAPHPELYDLKRDPAELHNLLPGESALAASYRERLAELLATYRPVYRAAAPMAPNSAESLGSLGYLEMSSSHAALDDSGVDPKDRLFEYQRFLLAGHLARTGKEDEAAAEYQSILADDPRNLPAHVELARLELAVHGYADAARELQAALDLAPRDGEAEELLGDTWLAAGNLQRAEAEYQHALAIAPGSYEAHRGLGIIAARRGDAGRAITEFRAALAANPASAEVHYQLGLVLEGQKQRDQAMREFEAAVQIDPQLHEAKQELAKLGARSAR